MIYRMRISNISDDFGIFSIYSFCAERLRYLHFMISNKILYKCAVYFQQSEFFHITGFLYFKHTVNYGKRVQIMKSRK